MSATNSTTHYELPVFLGSDKPAWLVDWNGAMGAIDSAIYEAKTTADGAVSSIATVSADLATLSSTVSSQGSDISTLSGSLTTLIGTVNTITSLIGNGEPTTTDKTIIGAINEINAKIPAGGYDASDISYDNTTSGLTADDVQEAVDEIVSDITTLETDLGKHTISAQTAVSLSYNTDYETLADGIFKINVGNDTSLYVAGYINGIPVMQGAGSTSSDTTLSVFVRAHSTIKFGGSSSRTSGTFYPFG